MYSELLYEVRDPVAIVTLNRPERLNALTGRLLAEMKHAIARALRFMGQYPVETAEPAQVQTAEP